MHQPGFMDVLDGVGLRTGVVLPREIIHKQGHIHRAVHLYLFDLQNNLLLQRRAAATDHFSSKLSISLTGHVDAGEGSQAALYREVREELGLDPETLHPQFLFSYRQDVTVSPIYTDRQFNDVYAAWHDFRAGDIAFDVRVISEVMTVPFETFRRMVIEGDDMLAGVYKSALPDLEYFLEAKLAE